eukprot:30504-Chlamydomonas_euryale.AAC.3
MVSPGRLGLAVHRGGPHQQRARIGLWMWHRRRPTCCKMCNASGLGMDVGTCWGGAGTGRAHLPW